MDLNDLKLYFGVLKGLLDQGEVYVKELKDLKSATKSVGARSAMAGTERKRNSEDAQGL